MATYPAESFYRGTIRQSIANNTSVPFTLKVSKIPTLTSWLLTISPNTSNEEIIEYSGVDGTALTITVIKRGINPSTQTLTVDWTDYNNVTYQKAHSQNDTIRGDVNHLHIIQDYGSLQSQINQKLNSAWGLRTWMGALREAVEIDASGNEITPTITNWTSIVNTETFRKRKADWSYEEIPFSTILNSITNGIMFNRTAVLGEDLSATTYQPIVKIMTGNSAPSPFVASSSFGSYGAGYEEYRAFDRASWTYYWLPANTDNTTDRWLKIDLGASYNIWAVDFQAYVGHPTNDAWATWCKIQWSTNDSTWTDLITYWTLPTTLTRNTCTPWSYRYVRFIGKKLNTTNWTPWVTTFDIYASTSNPKAMAIVSGAVVYSNTLGVNIAGNRLLTWIRFSVPYATTLWVVKVSQVSTSASARIQLRDDSWNLIAEQTPTLSTDTVTFPNTPIAANTVYRLVLNDNANFGNNSNELALVSYQAWFQFAISWTLNGNNSVVPQQIREIQLGSSRAVQATAWSTAEYAILAWFYSWAWVKGSQITLSANDWQLVNVDFADVWSRYYVSNTSWIIDIYAWTISRIVWAALTSTQIYLSNANYPWTNLSKP